MKFRFTHGVAFGVPLLFLALLAGAIAQPPLPAVPGTPPVIKMPKAINPGARGLVIPKDVKARHAASWAKHGHRLKALPTVTATSFDCRSLGWVPAFDDQGQCGDCWIFSGADCCASAFIKAGYGPKLTISKQQLLDCHFQDGCNGGWPEDVAKVAKESGLVTDADYGVPYQAGPGRCKSVDPSKVLKILDYGFCSQADGVASYQDFKNCMVKYGVISLCYDAEGTPNSGENGPVWQGTGGGNVDHAIKAIAFDDTKAPGGAVLCWNQWAAGGSDLFWAGWGANQLGTSAMWTSAVSAPVPPGPTPPGPVPPIGFPTYTITDPTGKVIGTATPGNVPSPAVAAELAAISDRLAKLSAELGGTPAEVGLTFNLAVLFDLIKLFGDVQSANNGVVKADLDALLAAIKARAGVLPALEKLAGDFAALGSPAVVADLAKLAADLGLVIPPTSPLTPKCCGK